MSPTPASRPAASHTPEEVKQAFVEDTKDLLSDLRDLLELPRLTDEQKRQVKAITGSLFAHCRQGRAG